MVGKKVLFLIPSLVCGGAERSLINILNHLDYSRYDVDLVVVSSNGIYMTQVPKSVTLISLFHNDLLVRILAYAQKKLYFTWLFKQMIKRKVKGNYDVGISFLDSNFTDLLFFVKNVKKRVAWVHASYKSYDNFAKFYKNKRYKEHLILNRYSKLDEIYFVSHDTMDEFIEVFGTFPIMKVIYNLIDSKSIVLKSKYDNINKNPNIQFVAIGSLLPVKGFDRLIRSTALVKARGYGIRLAILGTGPMQNKLEKLIKDLGMQEEVKLLGFLSNPYPLLRASDVFIMSSVSEALPTALCEAMILGKPTLVTNCSGCRELIDNEQFGLISDQNDEKLSQKMIQYITNPSLLKHYSEKSLERAELFHDTRILEEYYNVFDDVSPK
jgi:glycosyltransferase involved in cell wall biosynthesis